MSILTPKQEEELRQAVKWYCDHEVTTESQEV